MKPMPTKILPADEVWTYKADSDEWIVQKKSSDQALSKKDLTSSLNIISRLQQIKANILKNAVAKQDVVDFYLLSLLPPEYLSKTAIGPEHINGLALYQGVIEALREEYVRRGMDELKDEAETTRWTTEIADEDMDERLKPYYKFHESGYAGSGYYGDDEDDEPDYDTSCESCGQGLYEDDVVVFNGDSYCPDCADIVLGDTLEQSVSFDTKHNVFLIDAVSDSLEEELKDALGNSHYKIADIDKHEDCPTIGFEKGKEAWEEVKENLKKQLELKFRERKPKEKKPVTKKDQNGKCIHCGKLRGQHQAHTFECYPGSGTTFTSATQSSLTRPLSKKAVSGGPWWEAPETFEGLSSSDYYKLFEYAPWKESYGGPAWAEIAKTINQMEHETNWQKVALLIDHFHDLGHNTGKLLDKFPEWTKWFKKLLDLKASKDSIRQLIPLASPDVRNLVQEYYNVQGQDWRKSNYPTTDFSQSDLSAITHDKNVPPEVLFNAVKFVIEHNTGVGLNEFLRHPNFNLKYIPKVQKLLEKNKKELGDWVISDFNSFLNSKGLIKEKKKKKPVVPSPSLGLKVGDRVVLTDDASVGAGTVVELLNSGVGLGGFVSVKWDSPAEGEHPSTYDPKFLTKITNDDWTPTLKVGDKVHDKFDDRIGTITQILSDGTIHIQFQDGSLGYRTSDKLEKISSTTSNLKLSKKDKIAYEGGYPTEEDATYWGAAAPGTYAYEPKITHDSTTGLRERDDGKPLVICPRCKSNDIDKQSEQATCNACGTNFIPKPDRGSDDPEVNDYSQNYFYGPQDLGRVHQHQPGDSMWEPWGTEDSDGVSSNVMMSAFSGFMKKQSNLNKSAITKNYALYIGTVKYPAVRTLTRAKAEQILRERFPRAYATGDYVIAEEEFDTKQGNLKQAHCGPCTPLKMEAIKLFSDLIYKYPNDKTVDHSVAGDLGKLSSESSPKNFVSRMGEAIERLDTKEHKDLITKLTQIQMALSDVTTHLEDGSMKADKPLSKKEAFKPVKNVLIICSGNTCRSPMAENILKSIRPDLNVVSRGLYAGKELPMAQPAEEALKEQGIPYQPHKSQQVTAADVDTADMILVMENWQRDDLAALFPQAKNKTFLIGDAEIADPVGKTPDDYKKTRDELSKALSRFSSLNKQAAEPKPLSNKVVTELIPMFVDKTEPSDHKCATCRFRILTDGKGKETCAIMKGTINLDLGTCNYWSEGDASKEHNPSQMERKTAGYVEANTVNCGTCKHFNDGLCTLWNGTVKAEQCCMAWEGDVIKEGSLDNPYFTVQDIGMYAEKTPDYKHIRETLAQLVEKWDKKLAATLRGQMSDDSWEEQAALTLLNSKTAEGLQWQFHEGNLGLWPPLYDFDAALSKKEINKQASPDKRYWIAPDGTEFPVSGIHPVWILTEGEKILPNYGIDPTDKSTGEIHSEMLQKGWSRISNESRGRGTNYFQIEVGNLNKLPPYLDDFIPKHYEKGETILIGDGINKGVFIDNPFPSIQKAVNKELSLPKAAALDIPQETQNAIAKQYGPEVLIGLRFYEEALSYGHSPDRALAYAMDAMHKMNFNISESEFLKIFDEYRA